MTHPEIPEEAVAAVAAVLNDWFDVPVSAPAVSREALTAALPHLRVQETPPQRGGCPACGWPSLYNDSCTSCGWDQAKYEEAVAAGMPRLPGDRAPTPAPRPTFPTCECPKPAPNLSGRCDHCNNRLPTEEDTKGEGS